MNGFLKMTVTAALFLVLSLSPSLGYNILSQVRNPSVIQYGAPRILELNDEVEEVRDNEHANSMVRRVKSPASSNSKHGHKPRNEEKYRVKILDDHNNFLSVEIDNSLERILDILDAEENERYVANANYRNKGKKVSSNKLAKLDLSWADLDRIQENKDLIQKNDPSYIPFYNKIKKQERLDRPPKILNLGFKSVTLDELDEDRQDSAKRTGSSDAVKIIRSLEPPNKYYEKYLGNAVPSMKIFETNGKNDIESIFDKNGMLFLTKPKYSEERTLNTLLNKVIKYKELQRRGYDPDPKQIFSKAEQKQIKGIAKAMIEEDRKTDAELHELDKLFLREQQELQQIGKADLERLPEILKTAVPELPLPNSMKEKITQTLQQRLNLDDDEAKNYEEDVRNKANLVRLVAQAVEQTMGGSQEKRQTQDDQWDQGADDDRSQWNLIEENLRQVLGSKSPDKGGRAKRQKRIAPTGSFVPQSDDRD